VKEIGSALESEINIASNFFVFDVTSAHPTVGHVWEHIKLALLSETKFC
jgi:hypothetical protein